MTSACNIIDVVSGVVISIAAIVVAFLTCKYKRLVPIYAMFMVVTIVFPQAFALNWLSGIAYSGRLTRARAFSASVLTVCGWRVLPWLVVVAVEGILSAFLCQSSISMATAFADGAAIALKVYLVANAIGGITSDSTSRMFVQKSVSLAFEPERVISSYGGAIGNVVVAVDPNCKGPSDWALVTAFYAGPRMVICGLESKPVARLYDQRKIFLEHIGRIRRDFPFLQQSTIFLVVEANTGKQATYHGELLVEHNMMYGIKEICEDRNRPGIPMGPEFKRILITDFGNYLNNELVSIWRDIITSETKPRMIVQELHDQFSRYGIDKEHSAPSYEGGRRYKMSGKGPGGLLNDDLAMATMLNFAGQRIANSAIGREKYGRAVF